jgi:hypothetical protein
MNGVTSPEDNVITTLAIFPSRQLIRQRRLLDIHPPSASVLFWLEA